MDSMFLRRLRVLTLFIVFLIDVAVNVSDFSRHNNDKIVQFMFKNSTIL